MPPEAAQEGDRWYKEMYFRGDVQKTEPRRPTATYFIKAFGRALRSHGKAEISGRALSRSFDIDERAQRGLQALSQAGVKGAKLHYFVHVGVGDVRATRSFDVFHTEGGNPPDPAHADIVAEMRLAAKLHEDAVDKWEHEPFRMLADKSQICDGADSCLLSCLRA